MYKYVAYSPNIHGEYSNRIISVWADDDNGARREVHRALDRPGRRYLLHEWRAGSSHVRRGDR